jgi:hypothetical protein
LQVHVQVVVGIVVRSQATSVVVADAQATKHVRVSTLVQLWAWMYHKHVNAAQGLI